MILPSHLKYVAALPREVKNSNLSQITLCSSKRQPPNGDNFVKFEMIFTILLPLEREINLPFSHVMC